MGVRGILLMQGYDLGGCCGRPDRMEPGARSTCLRETCGLTFSEISMRIGCSLADAHLKSKEHSRQIKTSDEYAEAAANVLNQALCQIHEPVTRIRTGIQACSEQ